MKKFIIERKLPGAGNMSAEELKAIAQTSVTVVDRMGKPYKWVESFVTEDAIYCVHEAETKDVIQEHSAICHFPINKVEEVRTVIGPDTAR
jgi:membrane-bound ClpP family serine protease